jgi:O-acetyl-ADP-ribose deacetylase (regulator of RNase III)
MDHILPVIRGGKSTKGNVVPSCKKCNREKKYLLPFEMEGAGKASSMESLKKFMGGRVVVKVGDITRENVDAIVNAANGTLMGGGGVDGAIHRGGGSQILGACKEIRRRRYPDGLPTGQAVMTVAGKLPARYVIHTVGPVYSGDGKGKAELLASCYRNALSLAVEKGLKTIAFPAISTGVYGYPPAEAAQVSSHEIRRFLESGAVLEEVRLVFFSPQDADSFLENQSFGEEG